MRRARGPASVAFAAVVVCALLGGAAASAGPVGASAARVSAARLAALDPLRAQAPDGTSADYRSAQGVVGAFPSRAANGGPLHAASRLNLGGSAGLDDGVAVNRLRVCATSEITVLIDARGLRRSHRAGDAVVNAWFDWKRDGRWDEADRCGVDWAIQNVHIPIKRLGRHLVRAVPITFTAGAQAQELWFRVTITHDQNATSFTGAPPTPYTDGESEDYLFRAVSNGHVAFKRGTLSSPAHKGGTRARRTHPAAGARAHSAQGGADFQVSCDPNPAILDHGFGTAATIRFDVSDSNRDAGPIDGSKSRNNLYSSGWSGPALHPTNPQPRGLPRGRIAVDSFMLSSTDRDPTSDFLDAHSVIEHKSVSFFFSRAGSGSQTLKCYFDIVHAPVPPRPVRAPRPQPPPATVFLLEVSVSPSGGGTVNGNGINPPCNASACGYSFPAGTVVNLTATPAPGYTFVGWGGDCAGAGGCTVTMNAIHSVTATFAPTPPNPNPSGLKVAAACAISPGILPEAVTMLDANNVVIAGRNGSGQPKVAVVNATTCAPDAPVANGNPPVPSGVPAGTPVVGAAVGSDGNIYVGLNGPNKLYIGGWDGTTGQPLTAHGFDQGLVTFSSTGIFAADFVPGAPGSLVFAGASNGTPYVGSFDLETGAFTTDAIIAPAGDSWIPEGLRFDPSGVVDLRGIDVAHSSEFMAVESTSGGAPVSSIPIQYSDTGPPQRIDNVSGQLNVILNNSAGTAGDVTWSPPSTTTTLTQLPTIPGSNTFASGLAPITTSFGPMNAVGFTAEQGSSIATPYVALFNGSTFNAPLQLSAADDQALVNLIVDGSEAMVAVDVDRSGSIDLSTVVPTP